MSNFLVFGSAAIDLTFRLRTDLPEPGHSAQGDFEASPGGKGLYQALACTQLSKKQSITTLVSSIGKDPYGEQIQAFLAKENIQDCMEVHIPTKREPTLTDVVGKLETSGSRTRSIGCRAATDRLSEAFIQKEVKPLIEASDAILVTFDVATQATKETISMACAAGKAIVVNASPANGQMPLEVLEGVTYVVATHDEACEWLMKAGELEDGDLQVAEEVIGEKLLHYGAQSVIITLDRNGCVVMDRQGSRHYEAYPGGDEMGGTGARSSFCAGLAVALADPFDIAFALSTTNPEFNRIATASAARYLAVQRENIDGLPQRSDLDTLFRRLPPLKLLSNKPYQPTSRSSSTPDLKIVTAKSQKEKSG